MQYGCDPYQYFWTPLKRAANLLTDQATTHQLKEEQYFSRRFAALLHVDDVEQLNVMRAVGASLGELEVTTENKTRLLMLCYQLVGGRGALTISSVVERLVVLPEVCNELVELADYLDARTNKMYGPLPGLSNTPLKLHSAYHVREILAAIGYYTETTASPFQAGVLRLTEQKTELLFVTLDKSDALHEGVAYDDYAISRSLFHWQSQATTRPNTPTGQRYIEQAQNGWQFQLFVRINKQSPYRACGPIDFVSYHGSQPMNITWRLHELLTDELFQAFSVIRG